MVLFQENTETQVFFFLVQGKEGHSYFCFKYLKSYLKDPRDSERMLLGRSELAPLSLCLLNQIQSLYSLKHPRDSAAFR